MSQIDKVIYIPLLIWFSIGFSIFYWFIYSFYLTYFLSLFQVRRSYYQYVIFKIIYRINGITMLIPFINNYFLISNEKTLCYMYKKIASSSLYKNDF